MTAGELTWTWRGRQLPPLPDGVAFDEALHRYRIDGRQAPGVTGILADEYFGDANSPKARWGTSIHDHIFHHLLGTLDLKRVDRRIMARIEGFERAMVKLRCSALPGSWLGEFVVASRRFGYCGRIDFLFDRGATDIILDLKTGDDGEKSQLLAAAQVGGYGQALCEMGLTTMSRLRGAVAFIGEDGSDHVEDVNVREGAHAFNAKLTWNRHMRKI